MATRLVLTAIKNLNMADGASLRHINSYIKKKFPKCQSNEGELRKVIDQAVAFGAIKRTRNRYTLGEILNHIVEAKRRRVRRRRRRRRH